ncbi:MAG: ABC transporter substrate-binding protein [Anaerolineaceae bacterium]|jgi:iron complex transport system substrate-binding protein
MKKILTLLAVTIIIFLPACQAPASVSETPTLTHATEVPATESPATFYPTEELTEEPADAYPVENQIREVTIDYAKNFTLEYKDGYKLLTVTMPWMGATEPLYYALVPKGTEAKVSEQNAVVIYTPIESIITLSSTYLSFLEQIDKLDSLLAVDTVDYIFNNSVRESVNEGKIAQVGSGPTIDLEQVIELDPSLVMTSASGSPDWDTHPVLEQAGLPVVINSDYLEQDPLGRAEWGKFVAAFYDEESEADQIFDAMAERYQTAKTLVADQTDKVTVLVNTAYEGTWYMPGSQSYAAILLKDAGAQYLWDDLEGSGAMPVDFEVVVERAKDADFWLNVGFAGSLADLSAMDPRYADFSAYKNGKVFNNNARITEMGGTDYYEDGTANPDMVLMDLITIFYPDLAGGHELYFYRQLQ